MNQNSDYALDDYRSWILARMQKLKCEDPSRSKKNCWRIAQKEWIELRRQQKRLLRQQNE